MIEQVSSSCIRYLNLKDSELLRSSAFERVLVRYASEVESFSLNRKIEFLAGRVIAGELLNELGYSDYYLARKDSGEPLWPPNVVGSISHDKDLVGVIVDLKHRCRHVGLDVHATVDFEQVPRLIKRFEQMPESRLRAICDANSISMNMLLNLIWSAKEAAFKSLSQNKRVTHLRQLLTTEVVTECSVTHSFGFSFVAPDNTEREVISLFNDDYIRSTCRVTK
ncbi:4'-phosphopantetheinyl transferase [Idiomarina sp.]|uniref:4'-phosphopantetheinyl transferase family protein n=1 Tax=Idiomarina sp. TaxID=1874361 RepID=UPI0025B8C6B5|nr:4'-phosphopantetheinyl transferase superfamily protein [Idiomarina sp.]NQZ03486.1 4'-phosphopantetheinyl transferase superfamily protein [Idiomarina sp.]